MSVTDPSQAHPQNSVQAFSNHQGESGDHNHRSSKITGHNIERQDYVITNATLTIGDTVLNSRDIRIHLDTCLRCGQQWHETIVAKAKGVAV